MDGGAARSCYRATMEPSPAGTILAFVLLALALGGGLAVVVWLAVATVRGWRASKANPPESMAWLRAMSPNHEALPTPTRQAPLLRQSGSRWSIGRVAMYGFQALAIGLLMWGFSAAAAEKGERANLGAALLLSIVTVAFLTAVLTRLWDRANRKAKGSTVVALPATMATSPEHHEPVQERDRLGSRLGVGEVRKPPSSLWRGQQRG